MLIALAIVAPVPVAGAIAITAAMKFLIVGASILITIEALVSIKLAIASIAVKQEILHPVTQRSLLFLEFSLVSV